MKLKIFLLALVVAGAFGLDTFAQMKLNGAGATFPYVIYSKWFDEYHTKRELNLIISQLEAVEELNK